MLDPLARKSSLFELSFVQNLTDSTLNCRFVLGIGFFGTASAPILPMLVQTFRRKFPDVELRLYELNPDQQLAAFDDGRIDLGFSRPLPPDRRSELEEEVVYTDHLVIALPAIHRLAKHRVADWTSPSI